MPTPCIHKWHTIGSGREGRVVCTLCNRHAIVTIDPEPPTHLDRAAEAYERAASAILHGESGALTQLASAVNFLIRHAKEESK